jgi:hypothetical protein
MGSLLAAPGAIFFRAQVLHQDIYWGDVDLINDPLDVHGKCDLHFVGEPAEAFICEQFIGFRDTLTDGPHLPFRRFFLAQESGTLTGEPMHLVYRTVAFAQTDAPHDINHPITDAVRLSAIRSAFVEQPGESMVTVRRPPFPEGASPFANFPGLRFHLIFRDVCLFGQVAEQVEAFHCIRNIGLACGFEIRDVLLFFRTAFFFGIVFWCQGTQSMISVPFRPFFEPYPAPTKLFSVLLNVIQRNVLAGGKKP